jgi:hypothetical protein
MTTTVLLVASVSLMLMGYLLGKAIEMMIIAYREATNEQLDEHMTREAQLTRVSLERRTGPGKMLKQFEIAAVQLDKVLMKPYIESAIREKYAEVIHYN